MESKQYLNIKFEREPFGKAFFLKTIDFCKISRYINTFEQYNRDIQEQQGTGLGLMISKLLTQIHKGKFEINSEEKKGTKIIIKLPKIISNIEQ